ncbi:MAG: Na/Pi cotransporter family protein [Spirochaetes bacterium]|nr:Na/Pi cotransporter family protein [Spirochaetota bacterium]
MSLWDLFTLIGGLAVFLYGMILMNRNLTAIAGEKMKSVMLTLTKSRPRGFFSGLGITMVNQSSSATTVLEAALVGAGLMTFHQSVAVTLGAELGSTFLPHIVALPGVKEFAPIIIAAGFFASLMFKKQRTTNIALVILGFGLLFLGLNMMSESVKPLRYYQPFLDFMIKIEAPILGILFGIIFTMIIQSSGALAGLTIAMAAAGTITIEQAIPINVGATVGTVLTAILASFPLNWDSKRTAYWHVMSQTIGGIIAFILLLIHLPNGERLFIWLTKWITEVVFQTDCLKRQIAVGFTLVPLIKVILFFGIPKLLTGLVALFEKMLPPRESEKPFSVKYLNDQLIDGSVDIALEMAKKEILISADLVKDMFGKIDRAFKNKDAKLINEISETDAKVDTLYKTILPFLAKISQKELGEEETKRSINYLYIENELETIGDVIDKNFMVMAKKMINQNLSFSEQGSKELAELHGKVMGNIDRVVTALKEENAELAKEIVEIYSNINESSYQLLHIERLHKGVKESIGSSSIHLDMVNYYIRINEHIVYIAKRIIRLSKSHV